jgi:transcriptional regulator with XRE-family HTH domain
MNTYTAGQRIRKAREAKGLSVREAATRIGMGKSSLSEIENGESKFPSAEVIFKMAEVLGVTARWIIEGEDGDLSVSTKEESQLLEQFRGLNESSQSAVLALIQALRSK